MTVAGEEESHETLQLKVRFSRVAAKKLLFRLGKSSVELQKHSMLSANSPVHLQQPQQFGSS